MFDIALFTIRNWRSFSVDMRIQVELGKFQEVITLHKNKFGCKYQYIKDDIGMAYCTIRTKPKIVEDIVITEIVEFIKEVESLGVLPRIVIEGLPKNMPHLIAPLYEWSIKKEEVKQVANDSLPF